MMKAVVLVVSLGLLLGALAEDCVINVSESMVKGLYDSSQSDESCTTVWNNLVNQFARARENLTVCQELQLAVSATEPSFTVCQQKLEAAKQDLQADHTYSARVMEKKIQINELDAKKYQQAKSTLGQRIAAVSKDFKSFYRDLIFLNIGAGSSKQALKYYHRYLEGQPPGALLDDLVQSVYRDPAYENERFEYLLDFVRKLAGTSAKLSLYQIIYRAMVLHPQQRDSYLAMILALDIGKIAFTPENNVEARKLYLAIFEPATTYLKRQVEMGNYDELVTFATKYPYHFEEIENRLSTMDTAVWKKVNFNQFVTYPNRLPLAKQRLEAFRMLLLQINQRNKHDFASRLVLVAKELDQCETFIRSGQNDQTDQDRLSTVKSLFAKLDPTRDYVHYLKEAKQQ